MYRFSESVRIEHAAADVWAALVDFPNVPAWESGVLEVRQTSHGQPTVGTTFIARIPAMGGRLIRGNLATLSRLLDTKAADVQPTT